MPTATAVFTFLQYSAQQVEEALAQGQPPAFQPALPTWDDAFFTLCDELGVLAALEALPDPRQRPLIPLPLLVMLTICRFLHCHKRFRRLGGVLLQDRPLLERLGVAPQICERGYYRMASGSRSTRSVSRRCAAAWIPSRSTLCSPRPSRRCAVSTRIGLPRGSSSWIAISSGSKAAERNTSGAP